VRARAFLFVIRSEQIDSGLRQGRSEEWLRACFRSLTAQVLDVAVDQAGTENEEEEEITTKNNMNDAVDDNSMISSATNEVHIPSSPSSASSSSFEFVARHPQPGVACFARCFPLRGGSWDRLEVVHARRATGLLAAASARKKKRRPVTASTGSSSSSNTSSSSSPTSNAVADLLATTLANHRNPWHSAEAEDSVTSASEPLPAPEDLPVGLDGVALRHGVRRLALGACLPDAGGAAALLSSLAKLGLPGGVGGDGAGAGSGGDDYISGSTATSSVGSSSDGKDENTALREDMPGGRGERALQVLCNLLPERDGGLGPVLGAALLHEDEAVRKPAKQLLTRLQRCKFTAPATASLNPLFTALMEEEDGEEP